MRIFIVGLLSVLTSACAIDRTHTPLESTKDGPRIRVRGITDDSRPQPMPIVIVDGRVILSDSLAASAYLARLQPDSIASLEILKGQAAEAMYATGGGRGIIRITTRRAAAEDTSPRR